MNSLNRGEWSELYAVLFLILEPKLKIVDEELNDITSDIFELKQVILTVNKSFKYTISKNLVYVYLDEKEYSKLSLNEIKTAKNKLLKAVLNNNKTNGAFKIPTIEKFINKFSSSIIVKAKSFQKEDINIIANDKRIKKNVELKYSIKSSLGSPATLLNSSKHTNFRYIVKNLTKNDIIKINKINGRTKLLDRIKEIEKRNGVIKFDKVISESFEYNLKMIDDKMPLYLANTLINSYVNNTKDLKETFINSSTFKDKNFAIKKLSDLLLGICFSFVPSIKWNGKQQVNGGFIVIKKDGQVVILDLIYYKECVIKYLLNNSRLDSPSSTRFHMLELYEENNNIYFTLNLQIRYKH